MSGNRSKSAFFEGGWVTLSADLRGKGASPTNHCWYLSSGVIAVSCGIKIFAVHHLVLSQSTRVTDRRTDRETDRITTPKTALAYARAVKSMPYPSRDVGRVLISLPLAMSPQVDMPLSLCHTASVTPHLGYLLSRSLAGNKLHNTVWTQRHTIVSSLPKATTRWCPVRTQMRDQ